MVKQQIIRLCCVVMFGTGLTMCGPNTIGPSFLIFSMLLETWRPVRAYKLSANKLGARDALKSVAQILGSRRPRPAGRLSNVPPRAFSCIFAHRESRSAREATWQTLFCCLLFYVLAPALCFLLLKIRPATFPTGQAACARLRT